MCSKISMLLIFQSKKKCRHFYKILWQGMVRDCNNHKSHPFPERNLGGRGKEKLFSSFCLFSFQNKSMCLSWHIVNMYMIKNKVRQGEWRWGVGTDTDQPQFIVSARDLEETRRPRLRSILPNNLKRIMGQTFPTFTNIPLKRFLPQHPVGKDLVRTWPLLYSNRSARLDKRVKAASCAARSAYCV